jgi:subtilisin family serine protease
MMRPATRRRASLAAGLALVASLLPLQGSALAAAPPASSKLRGDLAAVVAGTRTVDPRISALVAGAQPGEVPYFVYLSQPNDASHRAALESLGARVLRSYRTLPVFALASSTATVSRVAATSWVAWLAPIELVFALGEPVADQTRGTPADVGAPAQWDANITGAGVRIAILDTGVDPTHPDLDDQDFRNWSSLLPNPPKVVARRDFNGGGCLGLAQDGHGHGTHVAGIAAGTGEGTPTGDDNGRVTGIAPGAELAVAKVLTDAGAGINSDLIAAMEWAALPDTGDVTGCAGIGADIVNLSLGSEARPDRLNSGSDVDMVSVFLNALAVKYGTLFVAAAGNSGPFVGSDLEAPGSAAQALSVAATSKDYDLNHDDTQSGDTCSGWQHPPATNEDDDCSGGVGTQPSSVAAFSGRGPSGDVWLRPDVAAPGYNIVSAQAASGAAISQNDMNSGTRTDPLYATASGTSMATPAAAGTAALLLQAYRQRYGGADPTGASGTTGVNAPTYALLRAALMNSATPDLYESRWILTTETDVRYDCPQPDPLFGLCSALELIPDTATGSLVLYDARNRGSDPYVGPLAEGAGKVQVGRAISALRDGVVIYSAGSGSGSAFGTGHRDFQGSWQLGAVTAGTSVTQRFVIHAAPGAAGQRVTFAFEAGQPSDGSAAIPTGKVAGAWSVSLPGKTNIQPGGNAGVSFTIKVPSGAPAGTYTGRVVATSSTGQVSRIPVFASVALHDPDLTAGNAPGAQARFASGNDVYGKDDTTWPSVAGTAPTGTNADWLVFPVDLASGLSEARFTAFDTTTHSDTYDLYVYDSRFDLIASTHPFTTDGVTDVVANEQRGPTTQASPQVLSLTSPAAGRFYVAVSRARVGGSLAGASFGGFVLTLDEIRTR